MFEAMSVNNGLVAITAAVGSLSIISTLVAIYQIYMRRNDRGRLQLAEREVKRLSDKPMISRNADIGRSKRRFQGTQRAKHGSSWLTGEKRGEGSDESSCSMLLASYDQTMNLRFPLPDEEQSWSKTQSSPDRKMPRHLDVLSALQEPRASKPLSAEVTANVPIYNWTKKPSQVHASSTPAMAQSRRPVKRDKDRSNSFWRDDLRASPLDAQIPYAGTQRPFDPSVPSQLPRYRRVATPFAPNAFRNGSVTNPRRFPQPKIHSGQVSTPPIMDFSEHSRSVAISEAMHGAKSSSDMISTFDTSPLHGVNDPVGFERDELYGFETYSSGRLNYALEDRGKKGSETRKEGGLNQAHEEDTSHDGRESPIGTNSEQGETSSDMSQMTERSTLYPLGEHQQPQEELQRSATVELPRPAKDRES